MAKRKQPRRTNGYSSVVSGRSPRLLIGLAAASVALIAIAAVTWLIVSPGDSSDGQNGATKTAVIVDQLQLTQPNTEFVSEARGLLAQAGYSVDYIPGEQVTVEFYRTLPERGYDLVLLRVHAGITTEVDAATGEKTDQEYVSLFTGEPYDDSKYSQEHLNRLGKATYEEGGEPLFGIGPEFVARSMEGEFDDALIVMMGCDGLRSQRTAEAFLDKGAEAFVSWTKPVSAPHTDRATEALLQRLLLDGLALEDAVSQTATEFGPDPTYDGELRVLTG